MVTERSLSSVQGCPSLTLEAEYQGWGFRVSGAGVVQGLEFRFWVLGSGIVVAGFVFRVYRSRFSVSLLGGSWVVISRITSRVTLLIIHIRGLLTPLITTHSHNIGAFIIRMGFWGP